MDNEWKKKFYRSTEWQNVRQLVIDRDAGVCQMCNKIIKGKIIVHHKIHLNKYNVSNLDVSLNPSNLICVCDECHKSHHKKGFKEITNKECIVTNDLNIDYERRNKVNGINTKCEKLMGIK